MYRNTTTSSLQIAIAAMGIIAAIIVVALAGRALAAGFTSYSDQVTCTTTGSATC